MNIPTELLDTPIKLEVSIFHPMSQELSDKFVIKNNLINGIDITEIRGEKRSGKTALMLECFMHDLLSNSDDFNSYIVTTNTRITDYFKSMINDNLYHIYKDADKKSLDRLKDYVSSHVFTSAEIIKAKILSGLKIDSVYIDPVDYFGTIDLLQLINTLKDNSVKKLFLFRTN